LPPARNIPGDIDIRGNRAHRLTAKKFAARSFLYVRQAAPANVIARQPLSQVIFNCRAGLGVGRFVGVNTQDVGSARVEAIRVLGIDKRKQKVPGTRAPGKAGAE
jgi:hypothetical protein